MSWISEQLVVVLFLDCFNSVFSGVLVLPDDIGGSDCLDQVLAVLWDPAQVKDKLSFDLSLGVESFVLLDCKRSKDDITFFITSVSLDKESSVLQGTIKCDLLALPVISSVEVEGVNEVACSLIV